MDLETAEQNLAPLLQAWENWEKHSKTQIKNLRDLKESLGRADLARAQKVIVQIESAQPPELPPADGLREIRDWCQQEEKQRPLRFSRQLREAAEAAGVACQMVGNEPPTLRLEPLTVELDFRRGEAVFSYARLELSRVGLDSARVLQERQKLVDSLETADFQPAEYLARLYEAYRRCLSSAGLRWGERVDLVDILPEVAFLQQSEKFRKDPSRDSFRPYGKVRFAYDLARLRRSRQLEHQGARLALGTATLGSTRNKDRVLFLEEAGQGQFYLSLAFQGGGPR